MVATVLYNWSGRMESRQEDNSTDGEGARASFWDLSILGSILREELLC
jgi:hypothetical protein